MEATLSRQLQTFFVTDYLDIDGDEDILTHNNTAAIQCGIRNLKEYRAQF